VLYAGYAGEREKNYFLRATDAIPINVALREESMRLGSTGRREENCQIMGCNSGRNKN
jgi:hypothetical protein